MVHHDRMDQLDQMDRLLFAAAKEQTESMPLDAAYMQILASHQKKQAKKAKRRSLIFACGLAAAALVLGLYFGANMFKQGFALPFFQPYAIVIDPPKTSPQEEIDISYGAVVAFPSFPLSNDITALLPAWLPSGFGPTDISHYEYPQWFAKSTVKEETYIRCEPVNEAWWYETDAPEIGCGQPITETITVEEESRVNVTWHIRVGEAQYVLIMFSNVSDSDMLRVIESIGKTGQ